MPVGLDVQTRRLDERCVFGGSPSRVMRLSNGGRQAYDQLLAGRVEGGAAATLAGRLVDAGMMHPLPPPAPADVTVVVPVRDRAAQLHRCLSSLGPAHPVVVVDDGSHDPAAVAAVVAAHGAQLVALPVNGGPAAARNAALPLVDTPLVAFCDSDCEPPPGWIEALAGHFADAQVAAVAPRVRGRAHGRASASPLDLGPLPAAVRPQTRVSYVPTAALVVRRSALEALHPPYFDPALRYGEDVDLVWRLVGAGHRVRYDPRVEVPHDEPARRLERARRRFAYGTSAAPLAGRHPGRLAPLVLNPWPTAAVLAALLGRPAVATGAWAIGALALRRRLRVERIPTHGVARASGRAVVQTGVGCGRWGVQFAGPLLVAGLFVRRTRVASAALLLAPALDAGFRSRRAGAAADELVGQAAYGAGVWAGALAARDLQAVLPVRGGRAASRGAHLTSV